MSYLYQGNILFVNLSNRDVRIEPVESYAKDYMGGRGINIKLLYDHLNPGTDALDPSSMITFGTGPLTGTYAPACGRIDLMAKSPITGFLGDSNAGGFWAPELKYAGFDHIAINGRADEPVYLWLNNDGAEVRDASHIWGRDNYQTTTLIRKELGDPDIKVLSIGPAGENMVSFASVLTDMGHAAGRTGMGMVMGAKRLKAIAVRGFRGIELADPEGFMNYALEIHQALRKDPLGLELSKYGVTRIYDDNMIKDPSYAAAGNFQNFEWPEAPEIHGFFKEHLIKKVGCFACPIQCMEFYSVPKIGKAITSCNVYYGTLWAAKIKDMHIWLELSALCQKMGIDTQSVGNILGWLMELSQRGIITEKDTDGIAMNWGEREAVIETTRKIALREGFGDLLADGIAFAAEKIGRGADDYAVHVKGLPLLAVNPFVSLSLAVSTMVGPRGDRMSGNVGEATGPETSGEGLVAAEIAMQDTLAVTDSIGVCQWTGPWVGLPFGIEQQARLFSLGTGMEITAEELMEYGCRIRNLEMIFDVCEGRTRGSFKFPKRLLNTPAPDGKFKGQQLKGERLDQFEREYYLLRGWNSETALPTRETLEKVGLKEVAQYLERIGKLSPNLG